MRLITKLTVQIKRGTLPGFIEILNNSVMEINSLNLLDNDRRNEKYSIEIAYSKRTRFTDFVEIVNSTSDKFSIVSIDHSFEDSIQGGLIRVTGKLPMEHQQDYQVGLVGAADLITDKIHEKPGHLFTSISRNVGLICGMSTAEGVPLEEVLRFFVLAEKDAAVLSSFSDLNGFPLVLKYDHQDDLIRTLQRIENTFAAFRIMTTTVPDPAFYRQLYGSVSIPVLSFFYDDIPLYVLTLVDKLMVKSRFNTDETTIGIIGLDDSAIRITSLLLKSGVYRVLGYGGSDREMMAFESAGGLATTADNILGNADIIVCLRDVLEQGDYEMFRPGLMVVSLLPEEALDDTVLAERGVRDLVQGDIHDIAMIFPGILKGAVESGKKYIDDMKMVAISRRLSKLLSEGFGFPGIFSNIHTIISDLFVTDDIDKI